MTDRRKAIVRRPCSAKVVEDNSLSIYEHPLDRLATEVHAANKTWWQDLLTGEPIKRNVGELLMLAVSELAEALEGHRKTSQMTSCHSIRCSTLRSLTASFDYSTSLAG